MSELYIGLMSGTSLDAIDTVVVSINENDISLVASFEQAFPTELRQKVLDICNGQKTTLPDIGLIDHQLGKLYATAANALLKQASLNPNQITAIGNHGQTVFHQPDSDAPFTMQLGDANLIAALTGIDTIADFRRIDMALGGQGAPLVPAFHQFLFDRRESTTVILNIGGVSNISVIPVSGDITGFDTGPGNLLMDDWCERHTGQTYDRNALWAKQGTTNSILLHQLLSDIFLSQNPPKSTGREHYNLAWLDEQVAQSSLQQSISTQDVQRTLSEFTAQSIAHQVIKYKQGNNCELLVCGGGANNPLLMELIQQHLSNWLVLPTIDRGIQGEYMEAMAFAWLARQRIHNQPSNLPSVTGAKQQASLGVYYPCVKAFT